MYYVSGHKLVRVWKGRPILTDEDQAEINAREKKAREY
jgi:hypothetical protein